MKVSAAYLEPCLEFNIDIEDDDRPNPSNKYSLDQKKFTFTLPNEFDFGKIHPDHLDNITNTTHKIASSNGLNFIPF